MKHQTVVTIDSCSPEVVALTEEFCNIRRKLIAKYPRACPDLHFITQDFNRDGDRIEGDGRVEVFAMMHSQVAILSKVRNRLNWTITTLIDLSDEFEAHMVVMEQKRKEEDERDEKFFDDLYGWLK